MKISVLIITVLIVQVCVMWQNIRLTFIIVQVSSTSFFDLFHGAVQTVQYGFGKLLTDVVTDVKETVDCTILAVQQMLSLSEDATRRYYEKCGNGMNSTSTDGNTTSVNEENLEKEIDDKINKTVSKVLDDYKPDEKIIELEKLLVKESEQLADVNDLLKKEIKKLSEEVGKDFKNVTHNDTDSSVETILHEIKVLEKKELNTRNASEAKEIHHVMSKVLDKIDAIEATEATENAKLDEIVGDLQNKSKDDSIVILKQEIKEWKEEESRNIGELKKEVQEHEKIIDRPKIEPECNHTQPVILNMGIPKDPTARSIILREISSDNITQAEVNDGDSHYKSLDGSQSSNETIQLVELTKRVNPETGPLTTTNSNINQTVINGNKTNEAVKIDNVYVRSESVANKSSDNMANNGTVIQRTNVALNTTSQEFSNIGHSNNTETISSINSSTTFTEKVQPLVVPSNETKTAANIESVVMKPPENNLTDKHLTSIPVFRYKGLFENKPMQTEELTTAHNEEMHTVNVKTNDTVTPDIPTTDKSMPVTETDFLTTPENKENTTVTTKPNDKVTPIISITSSSPANEDKPGFTTEPYNPLTPNTVVTDSASVSETRKPEGLTPKSNQDNPTITTELTAARNLPITNSLPVREYASLVEETTMLNEDNPIITTEPDDKATINLPMTDSLPVSETIVVEELTTANNDDNPIVNTEPNEPVTPSQSMIESSPANEELTTVADEDNPRVTTEPYDTRTPNQSMLDSSTTTENIPLEEITTAANEDKELIETATPDVSTTDSTPASETIPSDVTSVNPDDKESMPTTTSVNDSTDVTQDDTDITNTTEKGSTSCCKDFEQSLKSSINENTTSSMDVVNSRPTDTPELAIVATTQEAGTTLTTQIPTLRSGLVDNKNASFDYDSFFPSQTSKEVRQLAIKEARQLMKGRKRSERIINNILNSKRKGTFSLFRGAVPINTGK